MNFGLSEQKSVEGNGGLHEKLAEDIEAVPTQRSGDIQSLQAKSNMGINVVYSDGIAHIYVSDYSSKVLFRDSVTPCINQLEKVMPVRVHGVPPCLIPDAFELVVPDKVGVFLECCNPCSLKGICKGFPKEILSTIDRKDLVELRPFESPLREVGIEVNRACLFTCPFCFYKNFYEKEDRGFVAKEKILGLLDEMSAHGVSLVRFFGGDPVLRSDFPEIIEYAKGKGLFTIVNTNGLFRDAASRSRILACADSVIISVHGCDEHSEKILTGRGDLLIPVLASLRSILKSIPQKVVVSTLLTTFLLNNKERYGRLFERLGVQSWFVSRPLFTSNEIEQHQWLNICSQDIKDFADFASGWMEKTKMMVVLNNLPFCMLEKKDWGVISHNAQTNSMTRLFYDVNGFFKTGPSDGHIGVFMNAKSKSKDIVSEGQGKETSKQEFRGDFMDGRRNLGSDLMEAWRKSPFRVLGNGAPVPRECLACSVYLQCLGGSRTQAMSSFGSIDARDPWMVGPIK